MLQFVFRPTERRRAGQLNWKHVCLSVLTLSKGMLGHAATTCNPEWDYVVLKVDEWDHSQYVYMHTSFPLIFRIWQFTHVNGIFHILFWVKHFPIKTRGICWYYSCFSCFLWTSDTVGICAAVGVLTCSFLHHIVSFVHCKHTSRQFANLHGRNITAVRQGSKFLHSI